MLFVKNLATCRANVRQKAESVAVTLRSVRVLRESGMSDGGAIKDYVRANLARYKVPNDVEFLDTLLLEQGGVR